MGNYTGVGGIIYISYGNFAPLSNYPVKIQLLGHSGEIIEEVNTRTNKNGEYGSPFITVFDHSDFPLDVVKQIIIFAGTSGYVGLISYVPGFFVVNIGVGSHF